MTRIGILSDTHGFVHPRIIHFFEKVDEIWHAGDIGGMQTAEQLAGYKAFRAVYGNIDGQDIRSVYPKTQVFESEKVKVIMTHIGGYPGRYDNMVRLLIMEERPALFICGHSHILKIIYDQHHKMLVINPGAAGNFGVHTSITAVRLVVDDQQIRDLEVMDLKRGGQEEPFLPEPIG